MHRPNVILFMTDQLRRDTRGCCGNRSCGTPNLDALLRIDVTEPHHANRPPGPHASMYDPADIPPWENLHDDLAGKPHGHLRKRREWALANKDWQ